jgi:hypothetical protein
VLNDTPIRACKRCGVVYPRSTEHFSPAKSCKDGMRLQCRKCELEKCAARYQNNRDYIIEKTRRARENNIELHRLRDRIRYTNNPNRRWIGRKNKDKATARNREYRRLHPYPYDPEYGRARTARRRARVLNAEGTHTKADIQAQYQSQKGLCWHCSKLVGDDYHVDHLVPLVRGGSNGPRNIVISCPICNFSKGSKLPYEWNGRLF